MGTVIRYGAGVSLLVFALAVVGFVGSKGWLDDWLSGVTAVAGDTRAEVEDTALKDMRSALEALRDDLRALAAYGARVEMNTEDRLQAMDAALALLRSSAMSMAEAIPKPPDFAAMQESMVLVEIDDGHGSGVLIGTRTILTAGHVVRGSEGDATVTFQDGTKAKGRVVWMGWSDKETDMAAVRLDADAPFHAAEVECARPSEGARLFAIGNPLAGRAVSSELRVASERPWGSFLKASMVVQGDLAPGMSGGPVFDLAGRVVGLAQAVFLAPMGMSASFTGFNAVFPLSSICDALPTVARGAGR